MEASLSGTSQECPNCRHLLTIPDAVLSRGVSIGGYRIERAIGSGAMGEVFLATQLSMERAVALKVLPAQLASEKAYVERFLHEMRLAAQLEHPNIVTTIGAGEDSGIYYFAMAYVQGIPLDTHLRAYGAMADADAVAIAVKIAAALDYAWQSKQILHRDVKPANIMMDANGEPMLMDMGIAKRIHEDSDLTTIGMAMGTPHYMSPEQARGMKDLDFRADMYSLGATLYHLVVGEVPFPGTTAVEVVAKHLNEPLPPVRSRNERVSVACAELVETMMRKDLDARFPTWRACLAAMDRVLTGSSAAAVPAAVPVGVVVGAVAERADGGARGGRSAFGPFSRALGSARVRFAVAGAILAGILACWLAVALRGPTPRPGARAGVASPGPSPAAGPADPESQPAPRSARETSAGDETGKPASVAPVGERREALREQPAEAEKTTGTETEAETAAAKDESDDSGEGPPARKPAPRPDGEQAGEQAAPPGETPPAPPSSGYAATAPRTPNKPAKLPGLLDRVAAHLFRERYAAGLAAWQTGIETARSELTPDELAQLDAQVRDAASMDRRILESFREELGNTITVRLRGGKRKFRVGEVTRGRIKGLEIFEHGGIGYSFTPGELDPREKWRRLGTAEEAGVQALRGFLLLEVGKTEEAIDRFRLIPGAFSDALVRQVLKRKTD